MNGTVRLLLTGAAIALLANSQGCGSSKTPAPTPPPSDNGSRVVTDLSTISPADAFNPFGKKDSRASSAIVHDGNVGSQATAAAIGTVRHVGDDKHPGEQRLLNKKAAKFDMISMRVMDQLFGAMESLEDDDPIARLKLPTDLRPVIITGTLNSKGKLQDLLIEQHSGEAAVDKMVVKACKQGLYINNPPPDALTPEGTYKIRLETRVENYASMDGETWEFKTYLGMALL
jgi:hypothetical protein